MDKEVIGLVSGLLVVISAIPYAIRVKQGKIKPNITSWSLWTIIGLAILLTYWSSGAKANIWPAVSGLFVPLIIVLLAIKNNSQWTKLNKVEKYCLGFGLLSLAMWVKLNDEKNLVQYALYFALIADACAAVPTIFYVYRHPYDDRPFAWSMFALGYGLAVLAISDHTVANYILPVYMFIGASSIATLLALPRFKKKIALKEWI